MERTIPIAKWINRYLPANVKILVESEPRQFYIDRPIVRDVFLKYRTHYDKQQMSSPHFMDFLKTLGITHLLLNDQVSDSKPSKQDGDLRMLSKSSLVNMVQAVPSENIRDEKHVYYLYALK